MKYISKLLQKIDESGLYPKISRVFSAATPEVTVDGKKVLSFCSNNYLGLATDPRVIKAAAGAVKKYGTSCGGSRLISGNLAIQEELEKEISDFKGCEAAITFMTGYMANTGLLPSLMDMVEIYGLPTLPQQDNLIISDELNHASIVDGCRLSKAPRSIYKHRDLNDLERILKENRTKRKLIVTDGVFSMDGDLAPLPQIVELARQYQAILMVDDAHGTGVLGEQGGGTADHFKLKGKVDIIMGTFSKALGGVGGFVAGTAELVRFLRIRARSYIFSSALPPATVAGLIAAIKEIRRRPGLRQRLWQNADQLKSGLQNMGFDTLGSQSQIIPVFIGPEAKAIKMSEKLFELGIFVPPVRWPAVPQGKARLRCTVMATHSQEQIARALEGFKKVSQALGRS